MKLLRIPLTIVAIGGLLYFLFYPPGGKWSRTEPSSTAQRFGGAQASPGPAEVDVAASPDFAPIPLLPERRSLRICCALGADMRVSFAGIPVPFVEVGAMFEIDTMRQHHYDGGGARAEFLSVIDGKLGHAIPDVEQNGLLYSCTGGFVDSSHIRELVDWTAFFISRFDNHLETGGTFELEPEGASRFVHLDPVPAEIIARLGRDRVVLTLAQWTAYQTSIWHETAQWYGFAIWQLYPETASGFSPEDPFANAIGVLLLDDVDIREVLASQESFNRTVEALQVEVVQKFGPMPQDVSMAAIKAVDGIWWDSSRRVPEKGLVIRREFDIDGELEPWLLPREITPPELQAELDERCGPDPQPATLSVPKSLDGVPIGSYVTFELVMDGELAELPAFAGLDRIDQNYFPTMVEKIKEENRIEFGAGSDRPD